jgi:nitrite reductase/ring-hydroxylating ferredoxin subunit
VTDSEQVIDPIRTTRRVVLGGAAVLGAGVVLSACAGGDDAGDAADGTTEPAPVTTSDSTASEAAVAKASDVPVGSGLIVASAKAVITQPKEGEFKAFSALCTHKGCPVAKVSGDTISCTCHGSQFSTADGSVTKGPATEALSAMTVTERDGDLFVS